MKPKTKYTANWLYKHGKITRGQYDQWLALHGRKYVRHTKKSRDKQGK